MICPEIQPESSLELIERIEEYVKKYMNGLNDCSHDWMHVERVRSMALHLAQALNATNQFTVNLLVVEVAALLHDIGDFKHLRIDGTREENLNGALEELNLPEALREPIRWIHPRISFRYELEHTERETGPWAFELYCVQDADRLDAIGAIGIARCFAFSGLRNNPLYDFSAPPQLELTSQQYNDSNHTKKGNARNHIDEKLLKLVDMMKTVPGREEAMRRQSFLKSFVSQFDRECRLPKND